MSTAARSASHAASVCQFTRVFRSQLRRHVVRRTVSQFELSCIGSAAELAAARENATWDNQPFKLSEMISDKGQRSPWRRGPGSWIRQYNRAARPGVFALWGERLAKESYVYPSPTTDRERETTLNEVAPQSATAQVEQVTGAEVAQSRDDAIQRRLRSAGGRLAGHELRGQLQPISVAAQGARHLPDRPPIALLFATASYSFMPQGMLMDFTAFRPCSV